LRDVKENANQTRQDAESQRSSDAQVESHYRHASEATPQLLSHDTLDLIPYSGDATTPSSSRSLSRYPSSIGQASSITYELPYRHTVISALYVHGEILGLVCNMGTPAVSSPVLPDVPLPLHPTSTQLFTVHATGLDRFPFPRMRDNAINLSSFIDEEEFERDLFTKPSFFIRPGAASWDPTAWKMENSFAQKWGFLFKI
jgi:hypothetical protein